MKAFIKENLFSNVDALPARWSRDMLRALQLFNLLRFGLSIFLLAMIYFQGTTSSLGKANPTLFLVACVTLTVTGLFYFFNADNDKRAFKLITFLQFLVDIVLVTLMMHASGGILSGMTMVLFIIVAAGCVVLRLNYGSGLAVAAIALLWIEHMLSTKVLLNDSNFEAVGITSAGILVTSIIIAKLARRARNVEAESDQQHEDIIALSAINSALIQNLDIGILVTDNKGYIETSNPAAFDMLGEKKSPEMKNISDVHRELYYKHKLWLADKSESIVFLQNIHMDNDNSINVEFQHFGDHNIFTKITLKNETSLQEKAHQMTLAAMGRMATGIAHEIRNPLTTISAANELLVDKKYTSKSDIKATNMIAKNCERINHIIEEVLSIGRSSHIEMENIALRYWLQSFLSNYCEYGSHPVSHVKLYCDELTVRFSRQHLHQIMTNLCDNAFRYATPNSEEPLIIVAKEVNEKSILDVISPGDKIQANIAEKLFEPFFSTGKDRGGTGLGLYICKQICALNLAELQYIDTEAGNCFRLSFAHNSSSPITKTMTIEKTL
ncbi:MAG: sensor histidine kinase [Arenicella sp.]